MALLLSASLARLQYWQPDVVKMATCSTDADQRHIMLQEQVMQMVCRDVINGQGSGTLAAHVEWLGYRNGSPTLGSSLEGALPEAGADVAADEAIAIRRFVDG